jgi:CRISPR-associated protein Cst2
VAQVETSRVGFNDISREYVINEEERNQRVRALMESVTYSFLEPKGAHRNAIQDPDAYEAARAESLTKMRPARRPA